MWRVLFKRKEADELSSTDSLQHLLSHQSSEKPTTRDATDLADHQSRSKSNIASSFGLPDTILLRISEFLDEVDTLSSSFGAIKQYGQLGYVQRQLEKDLLGQ